MLRSGCHWRDLDLPGYPSVTHWRRIRFWQEGSALGYSGRHHRTGVKVSSIVEGNGLPLGAALAPGNIHDLDLAIATVERVKVGRKTRPGMVLANKGYDSCSFRKRLRNRGIKANIPE